jgi:hypothetical protein
MRDRPMAASSLESRLSFLSLLSLLPFSSLFHTYTERAFRRYYFKAALQNIISNHNLALTITTFSI